MQNINSILDGNKMYIITIYNMFWISITDNLLLKQKRPLYLIFLSINHLFI